jgi:hypothetical protein
MWPFTGGFLESNGSRMEVGNLLILLSLLALDESTFESKHKLTISFVFI